MTLPIGSQFKHGKDEILKFRQYRQDNNEHGEWIVRTEGDSYVWTKISDFMLYGGKYEAVCPYCGHDNKINDSDTDYIYLAEEASFDDFECSNCEKQFQINVSCNLVDGRTINSRPLEYKYK